MQRNRRYRDVDREKKDFVRHKRENHDFSGSPRESDEDDFETYAYEYRSQSYLRTPNIGDSHPKPLTSPSKRHSPYRSQWIISKHRSPEREERKQYKHYSPEKRSFKQYSPEKRTHKHHYSEKRTSRNYSPEKRQHSPNKSERVSTKHYTSNTAERPYKHQNHFPGDDGRYLNQSNSRDDHHDRETVNQAATTIQAAFKGYQARKVFWRQREHYREEQNNADSTRHRQDEFSLPSLTSVVYDSTVSVLAANADPNLGLTTSISALDSSQRNHVLRELKSKLTFSDEMPTANQLQTESSPTVVLLGGINPQNPDNYFLGGSMFVYNVQKDRWLFGGTMPEPRNYHGAVYLNGKIYVTGGYSPLQVYNRQMVSTQSMFQLTVRSKRWRRRADMHQARASHGTCVSEENILVMGGRDSTGKLLSTVEVYYPKRDQWSFAKPMPEAMMGMACAVLDGCVWVIGGIVSELHSSKYTVSNRVYTFDIQQQSWYHKPSLPEPRAYASAVSLKREIWLWCGVREDLSEDGYLLSSNTVFVFNYEVAKWEQHSAIGTSKHSSAVAKFGRRVYLLGGMSNVANSKDVLQENDFYNRENDRYSEGASLPLPVTGAAAVALPIDYIATSDPKWNLDNINDSKLEEAATKIQSVFRGFRTRRLISSNKYPVQAINSDIMQRGNYSTQSEGYQDKWRLFQRVQIDEWPPVPDPKNLSSEMNLRLGTLPKGYTVTAANTSGGTQVRRYIPLPEHVDPNLGMCGHICSIYKKTKKLLGLRKVEHLPSFARDMLTVSKLQDDSFPVVLVMGGLQPRDPVNLSYGKLIMRYSPLKNRWEYFGVLPEPRNYHAAAYYREVIYVTGGCDPDKRNCGEMVATKTTYCLNIHSSEWIQKSEMNCTRSHHSLVPFQGRLYAIGGRDHNGRLVASIESYDIDNDKWTKKHPMSHGRMGMTCVIYQDNIWCLGGIGLSEDNRSMSYPVLSSVISYDIVKDAWISRPPLRCPRAFATCVVVQKSMWLFGGASKDRGSNCLVSMASVDKYYPDEAQWMRRTLLNTPRHSAAVVAVESCVYVFGGISSQEWSAVAKNEMVVINDASLHDCSPLPLPLTGLAAIVVPPKSPSLRAESVALLLHAQLTFY